MRALLRETSGRTEDEVVDAVEELVAAGLLREVPEGDGLAFNLDALERLTYDSTSLIRRRLLHRRAAAALADRASLGVRSPARCCRGRPTRRCRRKRQRGVVPTERQISPVRSMPTPKPPVSMRRRLAWGILTRPRSTSLSARSPCPSATTTALFVS